MPRPTPHRPVHPDQRGRSAAAGSRSRTGYGSSEGSTNSAAPRGAAQSIACRSASRFATAVFVAAKPKSPSGRGPPDTPGSPARAGVAAEITVTRPNRRRACRGFMGDGQQRSRNPAPAQSSSFTTDRPRSRGLLRRSRCARTLPGTAWMERPALAPRPALSSMPFGADGAAPPTPGLRSPSVLHGRSSSLSTDRPRSGGLRSVAAAAHAPSRAPRGWSALPWHRAPPSLPCPSALTEQRPPPPAYAPPASFTDDPPPSPRTAPVLGGCAPSQPLRTHPPGHPDP
jgi:hypothetical protein